LEANKMLRDELNIKYLTESMILRYLRNESDAEEKFIVEKLRTNTLNRENYTLIKEMFKDGEFKKSDGISEQYKKDYSKFMELVKKRHKPDPGCLSRIEQLKKVTEPKAGQIWLTKAIPRFGNYEFEPVALPKYIYILTNPQPYQPLDNFDSVKSMKEYYSMLVLPISGNTEFATHKDYLFESGNDILNAEFMIETWLETNMLVCNLEKCVGELNGDQIGELLNVYFAGNSMEFDKDIYNRAKKGKFHDKDYGDIYDFQRVEEDNIEYLYEPVNKLDEFFFEIEQGKVIEKIYDLINEPVLAEAAGDENVIPPAQQKVYAELILLDDKNFQIKLVVLEEGQLYVRVKLLTHQGNSDDSIVIRNADKESYETLHNPKGLLIINDKLSDEELQRIESIDLLKAIHYLHITKLLKGRLIEVAFFVNEKFYSLKNLDFRNTE
jgi:hypothetical protein